MYNLRLISGYRQPVVYGTDAPLYYYLQRPGSLIKTHPYWAKIAIAEWYIKHARDPEHRHSGAWGWMLLLQAFSSSLKCRYESSLRKDRATIKHTNALMRILFEDLIKDRTIPMTFKATHSAAFFSPGLYRLYKWYKMSSPREYERSVRMAGASPTQAKR